MCRSASRVPQVLYVDARKRICVAVRCVYRSALCISQVVYVDTRESICVAVRCAYLRWIRARIYVSQCVASIPGSTCRYARGYMCCSVLRVPQVVYVDTRESMCHIYSRAHLREMREVDTARGRVYSQHAVLCSNAERDLHTRGNRPMKETP